MDFPKIKSIFIFQVYLRNDNLFTFCSVEKTTHETVGLRMRRHTQTKIKDKNSEIYMAFASNSKYAVIH